MKLLSVKFLSAYLSVGYRKIANIRNSMQIRKPVVPKQNLKNAFPFFFGKMSLPHTVYFSISNFLYKLTQPNGQLWKRRKKPNRLLRKPQCFYKIQVSSKGKVVKLVCLKTLL